METTETPRGHFPVQLQVALFTFTRIVMNTGYRMLYLFLPFIAEGLQVSRQSIEMIGTVRNGFGLIAPVLGSTADRYGRRFGIMLGLLLWIGGMLVVTLFPTYPGLMIGMVMLAIGKFVYDPAVYAHIGDTVPYQQRGLTLAVVDLGWSGAFFLGGPFVAWLIARGNWVTPLPVLAGIATLCLIGLVVIIPASQAAKHEAQRTGGADLRTLFHTGAAIAALVLVFMISISSEAINIVYGTWMAGSFGLQVTALGSTAIVIGIAEIVGEGLMGWLSDRLGKKLSLTLALSLYAVACLILPMFGFSLGAALVGVFIFYVGFEYTIVSTIPLNTELVPAARATFMGMVSASISIGRMLGTLLGPFLYDTFGIWGNGLVAAVLNVIALVVLLAFIRRD
ncbi:MAG: MFS transporter [Anaerolineae bacterium]|nr:MFS transporter [Anaerolineae bacterium]